LITISKFKDIIIREAQSQVGFPFFMPLLLDQNPYCVCLNGIK